ncbi:GH92 family glycosyl hydrolase [Mesonia mobilis]|uniref:GH92 family glycosyl hydrolase n=1 Tax=Mesonia mobilis TaxID=369791 RepID=UPI003F743D51
MKCFLKNSLIIALVMAFVHSQAQEKNLVKYVDPLIGTAKMGHTYPGATVPFGMVQLSPDTDTIPFAVNGKYNPDVYKYCAGYQYDDPTIVGFSHTHFSGTGHSDLGDFLLMPTTGKLQLNPGTASNPDSGYRSRFSHKNENAEAGYYQVELEDYNINAEFTASERVGMHQYTFNADDENHLIFDLTHGIYNYDGKNVWTFVRVENDTLVTGFRQTNGWARTRTVYFSMSFNKPIKNYGHQKNGKQTYTGFWRKFDQTKKRSENWRNVYDRSIGFMRPKLSDGSFLKDFDPLNTSQHGFIEGNSWNYSLYVPHKPQEMIQLMGGEKQFSQHLDSLFTMELPDKYFEHTEDISRDGIIANYVHGNEPSHHILYYYNYMDQAWKAQEKIRLILNEMYNPSPAGLGGNDDFGQMSAWYIFNSIGFYPMAPASGEFMLGSPKIYKADVKLPKGKQLHIEAKNQSEKNVYVKSVTLNGKAITNGIITFKELMEGGELVFKMSRKPNK